ncbi:S-adenosyl-L-methionine-dependent methyltransferase [Powellomyces hirtus]|nr:S-adenosyl-L-methionine-dependent methyltransferase [Powellomyces hirtus]
MEREDRPTAARQKLIDHFSGHDPTDQPSRWEELWKNGDFLPWDKGFPNPALHDLLTDHALMPGPVDDKTKKRRRALVPGCGKGYDVALLAAAGYDVWGLEASGHAVDAANQWVSELEKTSFRDYELLDKNVCRGSMNFLFGDFFKGDWVQEAAIDARKDFDLIYDHTTFALTGPSGCHNSSHPPPTPR